MGITKIYNFSTFKCPQSNASVFFLLLAIAILSSLILIANPGFFNHDELQKVDHILRYGFLDYIASYVRLHPGNEFGVPVRPVSFFIQGVVSLFLVKYPFLVHLVDVLMHGAIAFMLFVTTCRLSGNRQFAWVGAIIFLVCPLATFSVGWSAALMDRLYILFGFVGFVAADSYISGKRDWTALLTIFIASTLAILSKETALVLPGVLIVYLIFSLEPIRSKRLWTAFVVWSTPIFLYLLYRAPALINSFSGKTATPHSASLMNVPEGIFIYSAYPFLPLQGEAHATLQSSTSWIAVAAHLVLLILLWRAFSYRVVLAYLAGYLIFLIPVLPISIKGAHYLYGSGLAFSLAIGALLTLKWKGGHRMLVTIPIGLLVVAVLHSFAIQIFFYKTGLCMNRTMSTMESAYLASGRPEEMSILVEPGSPAYVLYRITYQRKQIGPYFPVKFNVIDWEMRNEVKTNYRFNKSCFIHEQPKFVRKAPELRIGDWGPQSTLVNKVPNAQPDGNAGIWIKILTSKELGEVQVLFAGRPAKSTYIQQRNLITALIAPENFSQVGKKAVSIRQVSTDKVYPVGMFSVEPVK